jgi:hypothetical protein
MARMTDAQLSKWASRYGITASDVKALRILTDKYARQQERSLNGEPHRSVADKADRNANATAWEKESDATGERIRTLAKSLGFDRVDFGVGLYPALEKGAETCIMIPD